LTQFYSKNSNSLKGTIEVPGDKSISQRALILGAMAIGQTQIKGLSTSEDVNNLIKNLKLLGVKIIKKNSITLIYGVGIGGFKKTKKKLDMGNSGTATRLMLGALCNQNFNAKFIGDKSLSGRNMYELIKPLKKMGVEINSKNNSLPILIKGCNETIPIIYNQKIPSAQIKSSVLIASLNSPGISTVIENTPTRNHTEILLKLFGAKIKINKFKKKNIIKLKGQKDLKAKNISIMGDPSSAAIIGSSALITKKSEIKIKNININKTRITFFNILKKMNAKIKISEKKIISKEIIGDITFKSSNLKGIHLNKQTVANMIDEIPIFCILASFAKGNSSFAGGKELKNKESNRIKSLYEGLKKCGIKVKKKSEGLMILGNSNNSNTNLVKVKTYFDHRIAMSFLIMGIASNKRIIVDNTSCIKTSFPNFLTLMKSIGAIFIKKNKKKLLKLKKTA
tara:strand:+ start:1393 stop:2748 length:1356 start_codon:yes stop_codon:yes gene_type:complete